LRDVCLGVPVQLGASGIERIVELSLSPAEREALSAAARQVSDMIKSLSALPSAAR
jgi:malate dehydrogenase